VLSCSLISKHHQPMTDESPRIAAIQMASGPNVSANLLEVERLVGEAVEAGARLAVLPENFGFMGKAERDLLTVKESEGVGRLQSFVAQLARRHGIWMVAGTIPLQADEPDRARAACMVFNDQGERVARYDKIHLFDVYLVDTEEHYAESETVEPGDRVVVLDTPFGRVGLAVCYDLRFPEMFRRMLDMGAEIFCLPAAFTAITGKAHWEILVRARAIENLAYVVAAGQGGFHLSGRETYGHSMIVNPWGVVLGETSRGGAVVCAPVEGGYLQATRRRFPALEHRRPDRF